MNIDEERFDKKVSSHEELSCPKCSSNLEKIQDPFMPDDIDFEICINCKEVWIKAGTFLSYKQWKKKKMAAREKEKELRKLENQI